MNKTIPTLLMIGILILTIQPSYAGSATWDLNPTSNDWNTAANWTPETVPNGASDTASFDVSNSPDLSLSATVQLAGMAFNAPASPYTITIPSGTILTITGVFGITNNSGILQEFVADKGSLAGGMIQFTNFATAGTMTHFDVLGESIPASRLEFFNFSKAGSAVIDLEASSEAGTSGGALFFNDVSSAGSATIIAHPAVAASGDTPLINFFDSSTAGSATITAEGGAAINAFGAFVSFNEASKAGTSAITVNGGQVGGALQASVSFTSTATADHAILTAHGGVDHGGEIDFFSSSTGGSAQVRVFGNGMLDISGNNLSSVTIGSLEGRGLVFLGARILSVGNNQLDTTFAGILQDGGRGGGTRGGLTKIGSGILTLRGASTYTGLTTVSAGTLVIANRNGSATGAGPVKVDAGRIGGGGTIAGGLTIGTGAGAGATLSPRLVSGETIVFTANGALTFNSDATYSDSISSVHGTVDSVTANGVTINDARLLLRDQRTAILPVGTVFTLINNTAATPISGTFRNLADGATIVVGSNNFQANYEGGDGNDLTLTVVP